MLLIIALILVVLWLTGNLALHITEGIIHVLIVIAVILTIVWVSQRFGNSR